MRDKATPKRTGFPESSSKLDEQDIVHNDVPLQMIVHVDISEKRTKNVDSKKKKEKVSTCDKYTSVHDHFDKPIDYVDTPTKNVVVEPTETTINPYVETSGKISIKTSTEPTFEPIGEPLVEPHTKSIDETHDEANPSNKFVMVDGTPVDILFFDTYVNDILDKSIDSSEDISDENSQNEKLKVQGEQNMEVDEGDDIPIANIKKKIIENVTKSQDKDSQEKAKEVVDVDKETETDK